MARDLGLADRIRAKGVRVVEVAGWQTRGNSDFTPKVSVNHHTAGPASGRTPALNVVINGRSDVTGPLANVYQSREPDGNDIAYIVASGKSNNAGIGSWRGISGNKNTHGLEIEHTGYGSVSQQRLEIAARIQAAFQEFSSRDANMVCQHFEWTTRKVDFRELGPWFNVGSFRSRVGFWIGRTAGGVTVPPNVPSVPTGPRILQLANPFMRGADVEDLQKKLKKVYFPSMVEDGIFGYDTNHVVVKFQEVAKLKPDGQVGPVTWDELNKRYTAATAPAVPVVPIPVPVLEEDEEEMIVLLAPGKPPRVIFGGRQFGFRDQQQYATFRWGVAAAGKKAIEWAVSVDQYNYLLSQYPGS